MKRGTLVGSVLALGVMLGGAASAETITTNYYGDPHWTRIDQPEVRQAVTNLPMQAWAGDRIWFRAGGCVQTGGSGKTWKRYVNPSGPNAYRIYHGQIQIPGVIDTMTNFSQLVSDSQWSPMFTVQGGGGPFPTPPSPISIGYTDDGYGDNGYYSHDDGTENQCLGIGPAWIELYICRADPAHGAGC